MLGKYFMKGYSMQKISLQRSGKDEYVFHGDKIADITSEVVNSRWHEMSVYIASGNKYVLAISYHSLVEYEENFHSVEDFEKLFSLDAKLKTDAREYFPVFTEKDEEFIRKTCIPLEASFSAACSKLSKNLSQSIKNEINNEIR